MSKLMGVEQLFEGRHFDREVIILCVRWYLRFKLSLRDLVEMMAERGLSLAHTTIMRALVQIAGAGKRPVLYCRDFKLGARHSTLQAQVDLGRPDVPVRIVPCGCDASIRYRRS